MKMATKLPSKRVQKIQKIFNIAVTIFGWVPVVLLGTWFGMLIYASLSITSSTVI